MRQRHVAVIAFGPGSDLSSVRDAHRHQVAHVVVVEA